jgi:phage tail-like protein
MPQTDEPYRNFNFRVEIEGVAVADFSEVDGLASETEVIEYRTGSMPGTGSLKLPGRTRYSNVVLRRGLTRDAELWNWRRAIVQGQPDRRTVGIVLQNEAHEDVLRWRLVRAWPCKWEGPSLKAEGNDVAIEALELAHEGLELDE